jgi:crotonobetaine/carnitine-CoA ligase
MDTSIRGLRDHPYADRTVGRLVAKMGQRLGDAPYIADNHAGPVSFGEFAQRVSRAAAGLAELGVNRDENVGVLMPNRVEFFVAAWAQPWRGGVTVPLHIALKGVMLRDAIVKCRVRTVITVPERVTELIAIARETGYPSRMIIFGALEESWPGTMHSWDALTTPAEVPPADTDPAEPAILMLTSGSTGGSKAVIKSHHFEFVWASFGAEGRQYYDDAHVWTCLPASHASTLSGAAYASMIAGTRLTVHERFSARGFWDTARRLEATHVNLVGRMMNVLMLQAPSPVDHQHGVRIVFGAPPPLEPQAFRERFGVEVSSQGYGMTEIWVSPQDVARQDWTRPSNYMSIAHPAMEVRLVAHDGRVLTPGSPERGEILVRPREPLWMFSGYFGDPDATVAAWQDLWFHTGDMASMDAEGGLYFHGRTRDTLRRGGENISAPEVEAIALTHPAIADAAVYGVPSELGEDEVKLDVILDPPGGITAAELLVFMSERSPAYMVPRFIDIVDSFPRTPSEKVQKHVLRERGVGPNTFDALQRGHARSH